MVILEEGKKYYYFSIDIFNNLNIAKVKLIRYFNTGKSYIEFVEVLHGSKGSSDKVYVPSVNLVDKLSIGKKEAIKSLLDEKPLEFEVKYEI